MQRSEDEAYSISAAEVRKSFDAAARHYDGAAVLQRTIADRLLESFEALRIRPAISLDLGSGTGYGSIQLGRRFKKTRVLQADLSENMLREARGKTARFFSRDHFLCADAVSLPLADHVVDLVFSNAMLQWRQAPDSVFAEIRRVLKPGGLFVFSSLGPDTLHELRESWRAVDDHVHVNAFVDMHDIGDALTRNGLADPVLSTEHLTLTYSDARQLMRELKHTGAVNINAGRRRSLTGKHRWRRMLKRYEVYRRDGALPVTCEVIYGHAWALGTPRGDKAARPISLKALRQGLRKRGRRD